MPHPRIRGALAGLPLWGARRREQQRRRSDPGRRRCRSKAMTPAETNFGPEGLSHQGWPAGTLRRCLPKLAVWTDPLVVREARTGPSAMQRRGFARRRACLGGAQGRAAEELAGFAPRVS